MSRTVPFTKASIRRAIDAARAAGMTVREIRPDGSLILGEIADCSPNQTGSNVHPDPYIMAAERVGNAKAQRKRHGRPS